MQITKFHHLVLPAGSHVPAFNSIEKLFVQKQLNFRDDSQIIKTCRRLYVVLFLRHGVFKSFHYPGGGI